MSIEFILSAVLQDGELCIGNKNNLLIKIPHDLSFFRKKTTGNVVVMGHETWKSIGKELPDRKNIVITDKKIKGVCCMSLPSFKKFFTKNTNKYFVIGGGKIFKSFMKDPVLRPNKIFITEIKLEKKIEIDTVFDDEYLSLYRLFGYSKQYYYPKDYMCVKYRFLMYEEAEKAVTHEIKYINTIEKILLSGSDRSDRTGVGVRSLFSKKISFDISSTIPLITTRNINFKAIVEELLWFCRGETDSSILKNRGVNIWNQNTTREFLDSRNLNYKEGELGPMYGFQMRSFGAKYPDKNGGFDQLLYVERLLKTDPFSRRIVISFLNPPDYDRGVLLPCHTYVQFYVEEIRGELYLSCFFNMRSSDFVLASCYNIVSYTILTYILALKCDMKPHRIIYHAVDCHIYKNHFSGTIEQLKKNIRPEPQLRVNDRIKNLSWKEIKFEDFDLVGYLPNKSIKLPMAI